jgi:aryl-alcohol dehydrogenase-like predicted oxidoreductase
VTDPSDFRSLRIPLRGGAGGMPVLGFGTLIADKAGTISATRDALAAGFRHIDCAERYRNEYAARLFSRSRISSGVGCSASLRASRIIFDMSKCIVTYAQDSPDLESGLVT